MLGVDYVLTIASEFLNDRMPLFGSHLPSLQCELISTLASSCSRHCLLIDCLFDYLNLFFLFLIDKLAIGNMLLDSPCSSNGKHIRLWLYLLCFSFVFDER
jgi:hypothetical protein